MEISLSFWTSHVDQIFDKSKILSTSEVQKDRLNSVKDSHCTIFPFPKMPSMIYLPFLGIMTALHASFGPLVPFAKAKRSPTIMDCFSKSKMKTNVKKF